jgi:hypothetical protein
MSQLVRNVTTETEATVVTVVTEVTVVTVVTEATVVTVVIEETVVTVVIEETEATDHQDVIVAIDQIDHQEINKQPQLQPPPVNKHQLLPNRQASQEAHQETMDQETIITNKIDNVVVQAARAVHQDQEQTCLE